ncbi:helix-turn-helix domain-containing protein [Dietzia cinnamea]|uniref:XRE family transcriptional regulator n=2 Tax=Dietzia TaxID=37914 RepID=A0A365PBG1_9ACTN|nr:XRE family transcriptional regulator [Dietzia cinnamea]MCT1883905.1 XRE family transcriptional regulator [Dietzia cinnamea]RBA37880.1 XRE family transcriptional regulator [Dietzia maris]
MPHSHRRAGQAPVEPLISASLGRAIREARTGNKLSMRALAAAAEMSQPFLSQIEAGQTMPSLATLYRIAKVLEISPAELLPAEPDPAPVHLSRADEATWVPISEKENAGTTRVVNKGLANVQEYRILPGQYLGDWFESDGELSVYVIEGTISVDLDGMDPFELGPGDAVTHPGGLRNRWSVVGDDPVRIILVYAGDR